MINSEHFVSSTITFRHRGHRTLVQRIVHAHVPVARRQRGRRVGRAQVARLGQHVLRRRVPALVPGVRVQRRPVARRQAAPRRRRLRAQVRPRSSADGQQNRARTRRVWVRLPRLGKLWASNDESDVVPRWTTTRRVGVELGSVRPAGQATQRACVWYSKRRA